MGENLWFMLQNILPCPSWPVLPDSLSHFVLSLALLGSCQPSSPCAILAHGPVVRGLLSNWRTNMSAEKSFTIGLTPVPQGEWLRLHSGCGTVRPCGSTISHLPRSKVRSCCRWALWWHYPLPFSPPKLFARTVLAGKPTGLISASWEPVDKECNPGSKLVTIQCLFIPSKMALYSFTDAPYCFLCLVSSLEHTDKTRRTLSNIMCFQGQGDTSNFYSISPFAISIWLQKQTKISQSTLSDM